MSPLRNLFDILGLLAVPFPRTSGLLYYFAVEERGDQRVPSSVLL